MENLAHNIIRTSFSQERMSYFPDESQIINCSKDNRQEKTFEALDWLAAMTSYIPIIKGNKWSGTMVSIVTLPGEIVKKKIG